MLSGLEPEYCEAEECCIDDCNLKDVQWICCDVYARDGFINIVAV